MTLQSNVHSVFFFTDTPTPEIYTLSLTTLFRSARHFRPSPARSLGGRKRRSPCGEGPSADRKSTRLNSSHANISYAVFCLKKKKRPCSSKTLKDIQT